MLRSSITHVLYFLFYAATLCCHAQLATVKDYYQTLEETSEETVTVTFVQEEFDLVEDFASLQQIILLRHGEPALDKKGWRKRKEAMKFIRAYDSVGVFTPEFVPVSLNSEEIEVIFTSTLNRSISTATQVFQRPEDQQAEALYREFERKIFAFPNIKLPLKWWLTGSRLFWFMGFNKKDIESFREAKKRAKKAALQLEANSEQSGKTLLVSHGLLNHFLVKYLKKNDWTEVYDGGKGYLSQKVLVKYPDD